MEHLEYRDEKGLFERIRRVRPRSVINDVRPIVDAVIKQGDQAVIRYTKLFDRVVTENLQVSPQEIRSAAKRVDPALKRAIKRAKRNIEAFHRSQMGSEPVVNTEQGVRCWRRSVPIPAVGLYVPGGNTPLFSTLLMLGVPARIAGCETIVVCSPPQKNGKIADQILYVSDLLGIEQVYKVGGAQAIAAMAFGTRTIPAVDKIFGPGNQYVTAAKQLVNSMGVAIDIPAGPSEVMVIADETARPEFVAADLLSQAEHGPDSQSILVTTSRDLADRIEGFIKEFAKGLNRLRIIQQSLDHGYVIITKTLDQAMEVANRYAPEHLILSVNDPESLALKVVNAGSVFLGHYSPESVGDYASGTNHTLPTSGFARVYSGVSLDSFVKKITFQHLSKQGLENLGHITETMALAEGLDAHALAVQVRLKGKK